VCPERLQLLKVRRLDAASPSGRLKDLIQFQFSKFYSRRLCNHSWRGRQSGESYLGSGFALCLSRPLFDIFTGGTLTPSSPT